MIIIVPTLGVIAKHTLVCNCL